MFLFIFLATCLVLSLLDALLAHAELRGKTFRCGISCSRHSDTVFQSDCLYQWCAVNTSEFDCISYNVVFKSVKMHIS